MLEVIDCFKRNDDTRETKTIDQIKGELMKYGRSYTDAALLQDIPISLRDKAYDTFIEAPPMSTSGSSPVDAFTSFPGVLDTLPTKGQISLVPKDINLPNLPKWSYVKQGKELSITRPCELIKENSRGYDYVPACNYEELVQMVAKLKSIISEGDASASSLPDVSPPITAVTSATGEPVFQGTNAPPSSEIVEEGHTEDLPASKTATSAS